MIAHSKAGAYTLNYCKDVSAGLLVMGAYVHSAFRERLLGEVINYVLNHTGLPVFISH